MKKILFLLFPLFLFSCSNYSSNESSEYDVELVELGEEADKSLAFNQDMDGDMQIVPRTTQQQISQSTPTPIQKKSLLKIIKEADLGIRVEDYATARKQIDALLQKYDAYISSENESKSGSWISNRLSIRIPVTHFDAFMGSVGDIAERVTHKQITAKDVSRRYVDIESRLKTKKEVREKYSSFLKNAKNIEEMLAVEEKVRLLTEEIESKEAELRYLSDKVNYSTITLSINQKLDYVFEDPDYAEPSFFQRVNRAFETGWHGILHLIVGITTVWPLVLIGIILFLALRRLFRPKANATKKE